MVSKKHLIDWMGDRQTGDTTLLTKAVYYYRARDYVFGDARQNFIWFMSEAGELASAVLGMLHAGEHPDFQRAHWGDDAITLLYRLAVIGVAAENIVKGEDEWVRNNAEVNRRAHEKVEATIDDIIDEVGDATMMLTMFLGEFSNEGADTAMTRKMIRKLEELIEAEEEDHA